MRKGSGGFTTPSLGCKWCPTAVLSPPYLHPLLRFNKWYDAWTGATMVQRWFRHMRSRDLSFNMADLVEAVKFQRVSAADAFFF